MTAVAIGLWSCLLLSVGGAAPLGLCFESDGRVHVEVMDSGGCGSPIASRAAPAVFAHGGAYAGIQSTEHCVSCNDVLVPLKSVVSRSKENIAPLPIASVNDVVVPLIIVWTEPIRWVNTGPAFPELPRLSTIVIRA